MKVFSGSSNKSLAQNLAKDLGLKLSPLDIHIFADGEKLVRVVDKVVGQHCVVVQSTSPTPNDYYMELFFIVDALKRSGAKSVIAVVPYLGYQRQDHVFRDGEAVSLEVIIKTLEAVGFNKLITFDLHSIKIPELFSIPVVHLSALPLFAEKIKGILSPGARGPVAGFPPAPQQSSGQASAVYPERSRRIGSPSTRATPRSLSGAVLVSPDMGGVRRIKILSEMLSNMPYMSIVKNRDLVTGKVEAVNIESPFSDWQKSAKTAFIVDDMISTGATIKEAVNLLAGKGIKDIFVFATHPVFSKNASLVLQESQAEKIFVTDTIDVPSSKQFPKLEILSVSKAIAKKLKNK